MVANESGEHDVWVDPSGRTYNAASGELVPNVQVLLRYDAEDSVEPNALVPASSVVLRDDTSSHRSLPSFATLLRFLWAAGAMLLLVLLAIELRRLRALRRGGLPWLGQNELIRSLAVTSGVHRSVDVLLHEAVSAPLTCGVWRPTILLPMDASDWREADLRRALVHELEHVRRGDWATQLLARVVCACYWFHPLVWMAWGRLRLEAERACAGDVLCAVVHEERVLGIEADRFEEKLDEAKEKAREAGVRFER